MVAMEKNGKPAVGIVARGFEKDAMATARSFGLPQFRYALVSECLTGLVPQQIEQEITSALDQIIEVLTTDAPGEAKAATGGMKPAQRITVEAAGEYAAVQK